MDDTDGNLLYDGGKRCTIFVVDFGEHMFTNGQQAFRTALEAVRNQISYMCCSGDLNEMAGVIFINTSNTNKEAENIDCMYVHRPLGTLDAEYVKELDSLLKADDMVAKLAPTLGESGTCNWAEVLFLCQRLFTYSGSVIRKKAIMFFTLNHDPIASDEKILKNVQSYVDDLRAKDTQLAVFLLDNLDEPTDSFWTFPLSDSNDRDTQYRSLISFDCQECQLSNKKRFRRYNIKKLRLKQVGEKKLAHQKSKAELDPYASQSSSIDQLQTEIKRKNYSLRATTSIPFKLGNGLEFAVGVYYLIKEQSKPTAVPLDSETNERLEYRTHYVAGNSNNGTAKTDTPVDTKEEETEHFEGEVKFSRNVGGVSVVLDRTEMEKLRRFDDPGITVIGFKPLSLLKPSHRMSPSKYIYPLENAITGSGTMYRALFKKCLERDLFILIRYTQKTNTTPQLAALVPLGKIEDEETTQSFHNYEGFHLIELPFAEDKRNLQDRLQAPKGEWHSADPTQIEAAKEFVARLTTAYSPDQFANPVLQRYYKGLEAMALDLDVDLENEKAFDQIRPYYENPALEKRVAKQLQSFRNACISEEPTSEPPKKRGKAGALGKDDEDLGKVTAKRSRKK